MIILIDDDKFIRLGWTLKAKKMSMPFLCFEDCDDFISNSDTINKDVEIYIDSNLARGLKGELESKKLYQLGFKNIFLTTGYSDLDISEFSWIKKLVSKEFPY